MVFYIRNRNTFNVEKMIECTTYTLSFDLTNSSTFQLSESIAEHLGDILCCYDVDPRWCGVITACTTTNDLTNVQARSIITLFDAEIKLTQTASESRPNNSAMVMMLKQNFVDIADQFYGYGYLTIQSYLNGGTADPDTNNANLFNAYSWIIDRINSGEWSVRATLESDGIVVMLRQAMTDETIYDCTTGRYKVNSVAQSFDVTAKITAYTEVTPATDPPTYTESTYYLLDDGTYTESASADGRVHGKWVSIINPKETDVEDTFAKNKYKTDVELMADFLPTQYIDGRKVVIKMQNGQLVHTVISSVTLSSSDKRYKIKTGGSISSLKKYIETAFIRSAQNERKINGMR